MGMSQQLINASLPGENSVKWRTILNGTGLLHEYMREVMGKFYIFLIAESIIIVRILGMLFVSLHFHKAHSSIFYL